MSQSENATVAKVCPVCHATIGAASPSVVCAQCGVAHHSECWRRNGRCATANCEGQPISTRTGEAVPMVQRPAPPPPAPVAAAPAPAGYAPAGAPPLGVPAAARLRPMGLLEIVDQTFRLYRSNFLLFFGIVAVVQIPLGVLGMIPGVQIGVWIVTLPVVLFANGALTKAVSDRYLGRQTSFGESYRYLFSRLWPFVGTILLAYLFVGVGFVMIIVPGFVFLFWITFLTPIFVIEGRRYFDAVLRGRFLVGQGVWGEVIVLGIVVGLLASVIRGILMIPTVLLIGVGASGPLSSNPAADLGFNPLHLVAGLLSGAGEALISPLLLVSVILLYYDSRIRKEGFDLQMLAQEMGLSGAGPAAAPPAPPPPPPPSAPASGGPV